MSRKSQHQITDDRIKAGVKISRQEAQRAYNPELGKERMLEILDFIIDEYLDTQVGYDKEGNFTGYINNNSVTMRLTIYQAQQVMLRFPYFNLSPLYQDWYIIGFNKKP